MWEQRSGGRFGDPDPYTWLLGVALAVLVLGSVVAFKAAFYGGVVG